MCAAAPSCCDGTWERTLLLGFPTGLGRRRCAGAAPAAEEAPQVAEGPKITWWARTHTLVKMAVRRNLKCKIKSGHKEEHVWHNENITNVFKPIEQKKKRYQLHAGSNDYLKLC
jgi:hypothetical protein